MNHSPVFVQLELLGLLFAEVGLVVIVVALLLRGHWPVAWKRVLCQIGLLAVLVVACSEISGFAPRLASWIQNLGRTNPANTVASSPTSTTPATRSVEAIPKTRRGPAALASGELGILPSLNRIESSAIKKPTIAASQVVASPLRPNFEPEILTRPVESGLVVLASFCLLWIAGTG